jgi:uncharacterized membrane protein
VTPTTKEIVVSSLPLHPAIVHLPLGLAFVLPVLAAGFAWALWTRRIRAGSWITIVALQAILLGAGMLAMNTGEREEHKVESIVPDAAMERHEGLAERFVWVTGATLVLAVLVLATARRPEAPRVLAMLTVAGTIVVATAAVQVGRAGGELVYRHNAGAAYAGARAATPDNQAEVVRAESPASPTTDESRVEDSRRPRRDHEKHRD